MPMSPQLKSVLKRSWPTIRIVLSVALLWKATSGIDWHALLSSELHLKPQWLIAGALCICLAYIGGGLRWGLLMRKAGFQGSLRGYIALYFSGGLINQGLPSTLGGDSYRAIAGTHLTKTGNLSDQTGMANELSHANEIKQASPKLRLGFAMVFLDRLIGLAGNNLLGGIGLILGGTTLAVWGQKLGYLITALMLLAGMLAALALWWQPLLNILSKLLERFELSKALPSIRLAFAWPANLGQALFALAIHCLNILAIGFCLKAYGADVPIEALMIGIPALSLLLMLPISISGWGLREATLTSVLALWGVSPSLTVLGSLSYGAITVLCVLPGAYKLLKK
ncbi:MAG: flippase-like domain-containing protein [Polynucleobacter sp.]|nr:flippase-like domain-containing protein [Polynucleobacter sp.]